MLKTWMTRAAVLAVGAAGLLATGCSTMNNTERGTFAGAGIGSVAGALIGNATGNPKTGAVVGALGGGLVGNLVGQDADRKEERVATIKQATAEQAYRDDQPARVSEIIDLTRQGQDETVILNHLKNNRMTFRLSVEDLNTLKANNVSPRVIAAMQNSSGTVVVHTPPPKTVVVREVVREPVYMGPPPPVMVVDPYYPPNRVYIRGRF
jgi:uncharacterized protein YcfJ